MFDRLRLGTMTAAAVAVRACAGLGLSATTALSKTVRKVVPCSGRKILDPIWTTAYITLNRDYIIYGMLFGLDMAGNIQPRMADPVSRSDDGLTVNMRLSFQVVVASINRWGSKDTMAQKVLGFIDDISATDDKTYVFKLNSPTGLVELALAKPSSNVPFIMPARTEATPVSEQIRSFS